MNSMLGYDIETGPETDEVLQDLYIPLDPASIPHPGEFDPASVKCGNLKDQLKIAAKIEEARASHALAVKNYAGTVADAVTNHYKAFVEKAALSGITGRILAFGHRKDVNGPSRGIGHIDEFDSEQAFVNDIWKFVGSYKSTCKVGFNTHGFDLPFLILRSYRLNVAIPPWVRDSRGYFHESFVDLATLWSFPRMHYPFPDSKLDTVARLLNVGRKTEGMCGGDFHKLYFGTPEERQQSFDYLNNDLDITWDCAVVMQVK